MQRSLYGDNRKLQEKKISLVIKRDNSVNNTGKEESLQAMAQKWRKVRQKGILGEKASKDGGNQC